MSTGHDKSVHHIVPFNVLLRVGVSLFALTALTLIAFWNNHYLGPLAAPVAFAIAIVKAMLVMMYFMGLKYDNWLNRVIFGLGFFFLALLYILSETDIVTRAVEHSTL